MLKRVRSLVVITLTMVMVFMAGTTNVYAKDSDTTGVRYEGYTKDGVKYTAYEETTLVVKNIGTDLQPLFIISKEITTHVTFSGWITPPEYIHYDQIEPSYGIQMSGNLYLTFATQDYDFLFRKETRADYTGTVIGHL